MAAGLGWAGWAGLGCGLWARAGAGAGALPRIQEILTMAFFRVQLAPSLSPRAGQSNDSGGPANI